MRKPPRGFVWLHVDRLDRADLKVWAVQWRDRRGRARYVVASYVVAEVPGVTMAWPDEREQPRAVVAYPGARVVRNAQEIIIR